ncbi:MAG: hypothetical protein ACIAQZ_04950 [Sedimentisphaeraceae bacterium JB056]
MLNKIMKLLLIVTIITFAIFSPIFGWLFLGYIGLILLIFFGGQIYVYLSLYVKGLLLKKRLSKNNRTISLNNVKQKISQGQGCIIVESPTLGWNVNRLWWCSDNKIPVDEEGERGVDLQIFDGLCTIVDCENYDKYISEETGTAKLFDVFIFSQRTEKCLIKHFGQSTEYYIPTGFVRVYRKIEENKRQKDIPNSSANICK